VLAAIDAIARAGGAEIGVPQDPASVTRAPRLSKADGVIDWSQPAAEIERRQRALEPWPRAVTFFTPADGTAQRLVLAAVEVGRRSPADARPGAVLDVDAGNPGGIFVACGSGTSLVIRRLVPEGRRPMTAGEFLRGSSLMPGSRLG
jgi:methionyl-tRNA formyltransferase